MIKNGVGGLEFLCSVPGRIGGLLRTNAGCFGRCVADVFVKATVMNDWGEIYEVGIDDFNFSYRSSMFPEGWIVLDATFRNKNLKYSSSARAVTDLPVYGGNGDFIKLITNHRVNSTNNKTTP